MGLGVFLSAGEPRGGYATPTGGHWLSAMLACGVGAAVLTVLARWGSPGRRVGLLLEQAALHVGPLRRPPQRR